MCYPLEKTVEWKVNSKALLNSWNQILLMYANNLVFGQVLTPEIFIAVAVSVVRVVSVGKTIYLSGIIIPK